MATTSQLHHRAIQMQNVQLIIQARMTSERLPGKVMLPILGLPVLEIMIERLFSWRDNIIVATTNDGTEQPIINLCKKMNVKYYQGDTNDVLGRYYETATKFGASDQTTIVRLTSDCPLIDDELTTKVIKIFSSAEYDIVNLGPHSGYPRGLDCTAFSYQLLKKTHQLAKMPSDREHVTLGMAKFQDIKTYSVAEGEDYSDFRLTLDEKDDYTAILTVFNNFHGDINFNYKELKKFLTENPSIKEINKHVLQK